jgi:hypothetical protein
MRRFALGLSVFVLTMVGGCSMRPSIEHYANQEPKLTLQDFFKGKTTAHGVVKDWRGTVIRRFSATIEGKFDKEGKGTLAEVFTWNDGEIQTRTWQVWPTGIDTFAGTAGDVVGQATGKAAGNALQWQYTLAVPVNGRVIHLHLDDWMYLLPDGTLMNLTDMRKFGIKVGQLVIFIQPVKK